MVSCYHRSICRVTSRICNTNMAKRFLLLVSLRIFLLLIPALALQNTISDVSGRLTSRVLNHSFPYFPPDVGAPKGLFPMLQCKGLRLEEATIDELQQYMSDGNLTSVDLAMCYMQRASQVENYIE